MSDRPKDLPKLDADRIYEIRNLLTHESSISFQSYRAHESVWMLLDFAERGASRDEATVKAEAIRDAASAQRTLASEARTRDGKAEHEDIADWLDDRAAAISPSLEGAHP